MVNLIGRTTPRTRLRTRSEVNENTYESGIKVTDKELAGLVPKRDGFH
jgi:hypothetical protein